MGEIFTGSRGPSVTVKCMSKKTFIDTGAMLSRSYALPAGPRVRLRLVHRSDLPGIRRLLEQRDVAADEIQLHRLVAYNPREHVVICATAFIGGQETLVGVAACALSECHEIETIVVDERLTEGLAQLLAAALADRRRAYARRVA